MRGVLEILGLLILLGGIIVIPLTVWRVFKGAAKGIGGVFDKADAFRVHSRAKQRESRIFELAASHGGAVTAFQASRATDMTLQEATEFLEGLVRAGAAEMVVRDSGTIEYRFPQE